MKRSRTATAIAGLALGLAVSGAIWWYFDTVALFFLVPFVPILFREADGRDADVRECPRCGFETTAPTVEYCPRDGTKLEG